MMIPADKPSSRQERWQSEVGTESFALSLGINMETYVLDICDSPNKATVPVESKARLTIEAASHRVCGSGRTRIARKEWY